jgi:ssDNA-binding replication factor A large subunit
MKAAGFTGKFRATDGTRVITGEINKDEIETVKVTTSTESRQKIKDMFKNGS